MSNGETLKLLSASESVLMPSGYAVVMKNLLPRLTKMGWDCFHIGWQHQGLPQPYGDEDGNTYVQVAPGTSSMNDPEFPLRMPEYINRHKPDCVFSLIDFWMSLGMIDYTNDAGVPYVNYFPQDGDPFYINWLDHLKKTHTPLTQSKFGVEAITDTVQNHGKGGWTRSFEIDHLWHGVDHKVFHPLKKQQLEEDRQGFLKQNPDTFVIGAIGKNTMRKQHPRVMEAFSIFAEDKSDVILMMKAGDPGNHQHQGNNLYDYARKLNLNTDKMRFIDKISDLTDGVSEVELNHLYNLFNVYVNGTSGEGFGIPTIESMAAGTPVIITDYTTGPEIVKDTGWIVPCNDYVIGEWNIRRGLIDIYKLVDAFEDAYNDRNKVKELGKKSLKRSKKFTWDKVVNKCDGILRSAVDRGAVKQ